MASSAPSPWVLAGSPTALGDPGSLVTLVDGQTFCLSSRNGDIDTDAAHGVFFADMRVLSRAHLRVGGLVPEPLAVQQEVADSATFVGRCPPPGSHDGNLLVIRRRRVGTVWHEHVELRNFSPVQVTTTVQLHVAADFADVFAIKEGRDELEGQHTLERGDNAMRFHWRNGEINRTAELTATGSPAQVTRQGFIWTVSIDSGSSWEVDFDLAVAIGTRWIARRHHHPDIPDAARANDVWAASRPRLRTTDARLAGAYERTIDDLAALRLHDPEGIRRPVLAAGAPWYMAMFGRDALIASYMALPVDQDLALGVLEALADLQGVKVDPDTEEQPGRIVHETRYLGAERITLTGHSAYYGSVDATPLYVVVLGELARWGLPEHDLRRLLPHADRALRWIDEYGDRDGDGFVEYLRATERGLPNQGWKDSGDAIRYRDGRIAEAPLALCEVQGYVYAAFAARSAIAERLGDADGTAHWAARASDLKQQFNDRFWIEDLGWLALALGPDKQPVDALTSNIGHCLWSGIVDEVHAKQVADRLLSAPMWTGWGIRTLAADERGFDPMSYHCGSVWPHDSALCAAGLARYGFTDAASKVIDGLLAAAEASHGRLPEFFCGLGRDDVSTPIPMPTSCSPQAWSSASALLLLRLLLGLEPDPDAGVRINPLPELSDEIAVRGIVSGGESYDVRVGSAGNEVRRVSAAS